MVLNHVPLLRPDISRTCAPGLQKVSEEASTRPLGERCPQLRLLSTRKDLLPKLQPRSAGSQAPFAQMEGPAAPSDTGLLLCFASRPLQDEMPWAPPQVKLGLRVMRRSSSQTARV